MRVVPIGPNSGTLLISPGDGATLIINSDINNTIYLGVDPNISASYQNNVVPLSPQSYLAVDGADDGDSVYAVCAAGQTADVFVVDGGLSFFQSGIISGGFRLGPKGFFLYSGTPALGNPPVFAAVPPGIVTDTFGNNLPLVGGSNPVVEIGNLAAGHIGMDAFGDEVLHAASGAELWLIPTNPSLELYDSLGNLIDSISATAHGSVQKGTTSYLTGTPTTFAQLLEGGLRLVQAGSPAVPPDVTGNGTDLILNSGSTGSDGSQVAVGETGGVTVQTQAGAPPNPLMTILGNLLVQQNVIPRVAGVAESFHTFAALGYQNSWLDGGRVPGKYRIEAAPANSVSLVGSLTVPAGFAVGQTIVTLPAGYRPGAGKTQSILGRNVTGATVAVFFQIGSGGNFTFQGGTVAAGDVLDFEGRIYLDA